MPMRNGRFIDAALRERPVARRDLVAKLRVANVGAMFDVRAAVFETTGDIRAMHGGGIADTLLEGYAALSRRRHRP